MAKYHINPETGRVNICRADDSKAKGCPFGGAEAHYTTKEGARSAYEKQNETFQSAPLKKLSSKEKEEVARQERIKRWGPEGGGPNVDGMNPDEAFAERKRFAKSAIQNFGLTSESSEEEIAEAAHSVGLPASFLKNRIGAEVHDAKRAELQKAWNKKYGKNAVKPAPVAIPGSNFVIDAQWENIPGEGKYKYIRSSDDKVKASIQLREGFYILGARDMVAGRLVKFELNQFGSLEDASEHFRDWAKLNPGVETSG